MPARNADPKISVSTGVTPDMYVALEKFASDNGILKGEKPNLSGVLLLAAAQYIGFELPAAEAHAASHGEEDPEEKRRKAREAEKARREAAMARVQALRDKMAKEAAGRHAA